MWSWSTSRPARKPNVVYRGRVGWHPDWSPTGKLLFRIHEDGVQQPNILDLETDGAVPGQFGRRNSDGVWSPDGKRIVFISDRE